MRWEYAQYAFENWREQDEWIMRYTFWAPGATTGRVDWHDKSSATSFNILDELNKLGAEGWEVFEIEATMGLVTAYGLDNAAHPISKRYWLKRQVA